MMNKNNASLNNLMAGLILGGLAGAAIGLLLAPMKGSDLRKEISDDIEKLFADSRQRGIKAIKEAREISLSLVSRAEKLLEYSNSIKDSGDKKAIEEFKEQVSELRKEIDEVLSIARSKKRHTSGD